MKKKNNKKKSVSSLHLKSIIIKGFSKKLQELNQVNDILRDSFDSNSSLSSGIKSEISQRPPIVEKKPERESSKNLQPLQPKTTIHYELRKEQNNSIYNQNDNHLMASLKLPAEDVYHPRDIPTTSSKVVLNFI